MNKGDKLVVEIVFKEVMPDGKYNFGFTEIDPTVKDYGAMVEYAAAAYAAKQVQPAPVAQDWWQPKVGDRVIMEAVLSHEYTDGDCLLNTQMSDGEKWEIICARSAIVGPAPVRARFAVGDEVFCLSQMERMEVVELTAGGMWKVRDGDFDVDIVPNHDLLTLAEARERLAK